MDLTLERLKQLLHYDPETGHFTWKVARRRVVAGDRAGHLGNKGYIEITVEGVQYLAHRLAWFYVHGVWPNYIDHDNGQRSDNRIKNLKNGTQADNLQGFHKPRANNKSGYRGVSWSERLQGWTSAYMRNGVSTFCGVHDTPEAAFQAIQDSKAGLEITARTDPRCGKSSKNR